MKKIYYNINGWICNRYPYDIMVDDTNRYIEVSDEEARLTYVCSGSGYAWRVKNGKLVEDIYDADVVNKFKLESELSKLNQWFEEIYDMQIKQYNRCVRLGVEYDAKYGTIAELDVKAVENGKRMAEIRNILQSR